MSERGTEGKEGMTPEQTALARRLAASPRFGWRPGMQAHWNSAVDGAEIFEVVGCGFGDPEDIPEGAQPVLTDDATAGALLSLLASRGWLASIRPAYGDEVGVVSGWFVERWEKRPVGSKLTPLVNYYGRTLGEAVATALLAAP